MKPHMKRGLTRVALALMLAGYCAVPAAMAEDAAYYRRSQPLWRKMPPG